MEKRTNIRAKLMTLSLICVVLLGMPYTIGVGTNQSVNNQENSVNVIQANDQGVDFSVQIGGFETQAIVREGKTYTKLILNQKGYTSEYGKAELPTLSYYIAVPQGATPTLSYQASTPQLVTGLSILPSQPPTPDTDGFIDPPFTVDNTFYSTNTFYPENPVDISAESIMRGCQLLRITVYPFTYNPVEKILKKYNTIDVSIDFSSGTGTYIPERYRSIYFQPLFDSFVLNSNCLEQPVATTTQNYFGTLSTGDRADLLIVVHDPFYEEILPLAEWRHKSGLETKVVKFSEIGSTATDLRNYMINAYTSWELPPSFLLIVGDADHVPVNYLYTHPYHGTYTGTDHWYIAIEGTDYLPEINEGRISVENENELTSVVNKILDYSKTPYMDVNWFDDVLLAAKQESGRYFVYTSERIYDYLNPAGYTCNRQYQGTTPPGSTAGVIDAINNGVIIANHRDHGAAQNDGYSYTGWSAPQFDTTHIPTLTNGRMYPIMFALHCDSGWFDGETDSESGNWESIGEVALRVENKGFVATVASSRVSYSGYNDEFCCGMYDAMWPDFDPNYPTGGSSNPFSGPVYKIGQVMNYGKFWMYDKYIVPGGCSPYPWTPSQTNSRTTFEMFHVHGDPTMEVWTWMPETLSVAHADVLPYAPSEVEVTVTSGGNPVAGAIVCLTQEDGMFARGITNPSGVAVIPIEPVSIEDISIVVTAHNYLPYEAAVPVFASDPPERPNAPSGPVSGNTLVDYEYTASTSDPNGDQILYMFDWGDGTNSGWIGPYDSGMMCTAVHSWSDPDDYEVKVRARDVLGATSEWSDPISVYIGIPLLNITRISGGLACLNIDVQNMGMIDAIDIPWNVSIKRKMYSYDAGYAKDFNGIFTLTPDESTKLKCQPLFGFGGLKATIKVHDMEQSVDGFVIGVFIILQTP